MTGMTNYLKQSIRTNGPMSIASFMAECLMNPKYGYYQKKPVFGTAGDFITAPEISQMFGEIIGLWLMDAWGKMGSPNPVRLVEFGPGRGTLMQDIIRSLILEPSLAEAATVHFIEESAQLKKLQKKAVPIATWHKDISEVPDGPILLVANEFFDALPIHQFQRKDGVWYEKYVQLDKDDRLAFVLGPPSSKLAMLDKNLRNQSSDGIAEISPATTSIMGDIANRIQTQGGVALIIDYGYDTTQMGDTLQAVKDHKFCDILSNPGEVDLTAHVNFEHLLNIAHEATLKSYGPIGQGSFLMNLGLGIRASNLAKNKPQEETSSILSALKRLTSPEEMGTLFRVIAITSPNQTIPVAGFYGSKRT